MRLLLPLTTSNLNERLTLDSLDGILGKDPTNFVDIAVASEEVLQIFGSQLQSAIRDHAGCIYPLQDQSQVSIHHLSNFQSRIPKGDLEGYGMARSDERRVGKE